MKMRMLIAGLLLWSLAASPATRAQDSATLTAIDSVLDEFHAAAAEGDWVRYFNLMSADGVFLGSDAGERWPKAEFQAYASGSRGWKYTPQARHVNLTPDGKTAWFDEILLSANYGTSRGSGVLISTDAGWKISQYNLSFPIPNDLAKEITDAIKAYESR
jgi:hypothetical protein